MQITRSKTTIIIRYRYRYIKISDKNRNVIVVYHITIKVLFKIKYNKINSLILFIRYKISHYFLN